MRPPTSPPPTSSFADIRAETAGVIDPILGKDCMASALLTECDRANPLEAKTRHAVSRK